MKANDPATSVWYLVQNTVGGIEFKEEFKEKKKIMYSNESIFNHSINFYVLLFDNYIQAPVVLTKREKKKDQMKYDYFMMFAFQFVSAYMLEIIVR